MQTRLLLQLTRKVRLGESLRLPAGEGGGHVPKDRGHDDPGVPGSGRWPRACLWPARARGASCAAKPSGLGAPLGSDRAFSPWGFSLRAGEQRADGETERCVWKEPPEARGKEAGLFQAGAACAREFPAL